MAIIVEDGTRPAGANSYISVADSRTYHAARANTAWSTLTDEEAEQALIRGTQYMESAYRARWKGYRVNADQLMMWPRQNVVIEDAPYGQIVSPTAVPVEVKNACAEFALRASSEDLAPDVTQQVLSETIGPIKTDYDRSSPQHTIYRAVDAMLSIYLINTSRLVRM